MNNLRLLVATFMALPFLIFFAYFLPGNIVEDCMIAVISAGLIAAPVLALAFIVTTICGAIGGGIRRR